MIIEDSSLLKIVWTKFCNSELRNNKSTNLRRKSNSTNDAYKMSKLRFLIVKCIVSI